MSNYIDLPVEGGGGVSSLNTLTGALTLAAGSGITITPSGGNTLTIASTGGGGSVTSVSVVSANGFAGTVATATTTPAITLSTTITGILKGDGTAILAAVPGTDYQLPLTLGNLTDAGTDGIVITGGTGAIVGSGTSIAQHVADATHNGYLSSADWTTFNSKQTAGNYITALTGDGAAAGPGSVAFTLAIVNSSPGSFGSASTSLSAIVNGKGLITALSSQAIQIAESQVTNLVSDLAAKQSTTLTDTHILVGNASNVATSVAVSGDLTLANTGAFTIANLAVTNAKIANSTIDLTIKVTGLLPVANGGTNASSAPAARVQLNIDERSTFSNAPYTVLSTDRYVAQVGTLTGPQTVTLPAASSINAGQQLIIADESGTATTTNIITIAAAGSDTINGSASKTIRAAYGYINLYSNGTNMWFAGVEAIGRGGTGISTLPADGQILIGNSSTNAYNLSAITAGSGIAITNGNGSISIATSGGGTGTVTSVAATVPADLSVTGSPITTSGTLAITRNTQNANLFLVGPTSGAAAIPNYRAVSTLDFPSAMIFYFGDGSSGALSISSGTTTLTNDVYYTNLTISGTAVLNTAGFKVYVNGILDISAAPAGAIINNGGNGGAGAAAGTAGTAGTITGVGSTFVQPSGNAGGAGGTTTGSAAANAGTSTPCQGGGAQSGGTGGTGTAGNTGGVGGTASAAGGAVQIRRFEANFVKAGAASISGFFAAGKAIAGGGGGGDGSISGGGGGGGGAPAGGIWISAYTVARGSNATAAIIQAKGGTGGAGGTPISGNTAGGGAGSGGGGGYVFFAYFIATGSTITNAIDVSGGAGGTGGTSRGTATSGGSGGGNGQSGRVTIINIGSATSTETAPITATAGSAASGLTGGAGANINTSQVNL